MANEHDTVSKGYLNEPQDSFQQYAFYCLTLKSSINVNYFLWFSFLVCAWFQKRDINSGDVQRLYVMHQDFRVSFYDLNILFFSIYDIPVVVQGRKCVTVTVNAIGCGFDSHSRKLFGVEVKHDIEFRHSTRNKSRIRW